MKKYFQNRYLWFPISLFFMCISMWLLTYTFFDNDGWFILNNGRYILEHGIPMTNPFTWLEGLDIIIQQWLWSVITFSFFNAMGPWGIMLLCMGTYILVLFLFTKICKLYNIPYSRSVLFGAGILLCLFQFLNIRPTFVTVALLLWQVYILEKYKKDGKLLQLLWLPIISLLEINLHAAIWIFHFVFLLPYLVPEIKNRFVKFEVCRIHRLPILLISIPMFLAGLINPYGMKAVMYLFYSYGKELKAAEIMELQAPALNNYIGLLIVLLITITVSWISRNKDLKLQSSFFYILCGTTILSFAHVRNTVYFVVGFLLFAVHMLPLIKFNLYKLNNKSSFVLTIAVFLMIIFSFSPMNCIILKNPQMEDDTFRPVKAINYLKEHHVPTDAHIYTTFNAGGFVEWSGYKCYMDARPELYFKSLNGTMDAFKDYISMKTERNPQKIEQFIKDYAFEWMIVDDKEVLSTYLDLSRTGHVVVNGDGYRLYKIE